MIITEVVDSDDEAPPSVHHLLERLRVPEEYGRLQYEAGACNPTCAVPSLPHSSMQITRLFAF